MLILPDSLSRRVAALRRRISSLARIRDVVGLPSELDLRESEWTTITRPLEQLEAGLLLRLEHAIADRRRAPRLLSHVLGELELRVSRAFSLYDTYMDILTQRHSPELGPLLRGCDAIARDALVRAHPALQLADNPIVHCDRGFGASVVRSGVSLYEGIANPAPLIQVPYERLKEKLHLTSLAHEVGHEALARLGLVRLLPVALRDGVVRAGSPEPVAEFYALWASELGPDLWAFLACGPAHAATILEILALPPSHAFQLSSTDPHPPPYVRALCAFDWCRQAWGRGPWDDWEAEWVSTYPLEDAPAATRPLFEAARLAVPTVTRVLLRTRFRALRGRELTALFDLDALAPAALARRARDLGPRGAPPPSLPPTQGLAVFRAAVGAGLLGDDQVDRAMSGWLHGLGAGRAASNVVPQRMGKVS